MKNREPLASSLQEAFAFSCFFLREERASAKVLRDYVTRIIFGDTFFGLDTAVSA